MRSLKEETFDKLFWAICAIMDTLECQIDQDDELFTEFKEVDKIIKEYQGNSFEFAWCDECQRYIHESEHKWVNGDLAVCRRCETNLEM